MSKIHWTPKVLPEMDDLQDVISRLGDYATVEQVGEVSVKSIKLPLVTVSVGNPDPKTPVLGLFGGVHGLERIGTKVILSFLRTLSELIRWDRFTRDLLGASRLVMMPLVNPGGMYLQSRSNPNGVDLMRNSPVKAENLPSYQIFSGHRLSPRLPWYRGKEGSPMEPEATAVCKLVSERIFCSEFSICLDIHSGYGSRDRLWFPYAKTKRPFPHIAEVYSLKNILDRTYPNHVYRVEPQSKEYLTHGDLWDFLYDEHGKTEGASTFLPFSLELGSWLWVKKRPHQLSSLLGMFNPVAPHRLQRTLRRHIALLDFLLRAVVAHRSWCHLEPELRTSMGKQAKEKWYGRG